ncbi:MAG: gas vesicle protein [Bacteroidetes bacterium SW_9_63_38]|nr:MAG: gas vesicle protein [Bacteroidetes bacterium SW_9_63_38]
MASSSKRTSPRLPQSDTLADILERVLETGIVVAGDIRVNLNDVELLTIQIRLLICSVDKADEMGIDWWKSADFLKDGSGEETPDASEESLPVDELNDRLARLEERPDSLDDGADEGGE